ncbi:MAG: hypothetical protein ACK5LJ_08535 [Paracoccus sp. (in: a-proteobacteria)]
MAAPATALIGLATTAPAAVPVVAQVVVLGPQPAGARSDAMQAGAKI